MMEAPAIYAVSMNPFDRSAEEERIAAWSELVPLERAQRISRFRRWEDQWRSLAGDMLVRYVLKERYGLPASAILFNRNADNKPELVGGELQFNVSHSGIWAVAAFHSEPVGVDIEKVGIADMGLARSMFAPSEYEALCRLSAERRNRFFYDIWTGKESYIKALGKGLSLPLDSFSVAGEAGGLAMGICSSFVKEAAAGEHGLNGLNHHKEGSHDEAAPLGLLKPFMVETGATRSWHLRQCHVGDEYALTVCSLSPSWPNGITIVNAAQLH
jgi:4'-phosphopantetheinyl transferase